MKWPEVRVSDYCLLAIDCVNKTAPVVETETPYRMIRTSDIAKGRVDLTNLRYVTEETFEKWTRRAKPQFGDVILSREAPIGNVGRITTSDNLFLGQRLFMYRTDPSKLDSRFLSYMLQSQEVQGRILSKGFGVTVQHIKVGDAENLVIPIPPLPVQKKIADILSAYDDLIEVNRRSIQLLEESARRLYKEWFVHFRFPNHEKVKMVDGLPEGWKKGCLSDVANITMGQSPESQFFNDVGNGLPFHQGVTDYGFRYVTNTGYSTEGSRFAEDGDILFSVRAPVGRLNITSQRIIIGRGLSAMRSKNGTQSHLYYLLKEAFFKEDMIGSSGSIFSSVNKKDLHDFEIQIASPLVIHEFERVVKPIDEKLLAQTKEVELLQEARDRILPRLMSGKMIVT